MKKLNDAIIFSKIYLQNYEMEDIYKKKISKKNIIINRQQKVIYNLKKEINNILNYNKYATLNL